MSCHAAAAAAAALLLSWGPRAAGASRSAASSMDTSTSGGNGTASEDKTGKQKSKGLSVQQEREQEYSRSAVLATEISSLCGGSCAFTAARDRSGASERLSPNPFSLPTPSLQPVLSCLTALILSLCLPLSTALSTRAARALSSHFLVSIIIQFATSSWPPPRHGASTVSETRPFSSTYKGFGMSSACPLAVPDSH